MAKEIMEEFAFQTGVASNKPQRRYLWTDAFAVCNFIELYRLTGEIGYKNLAVSLVDKVHYTLGRHREDDVREGWISGLNEEEGKMHPTIGGLRIGKKFNERKPNEPFDDALEWERDGQYYHYLTKWMFALNKLSKAVDNQTYNLWAIELAKTAHSAFIYYTPSSEKRMCWKMSIDLSYPLVHAMGQHDPLDGLIVYVILQLSSPNKSKWPSLDSEINDMKDMCKLADWTTSDPLGIGELLCNAYKAAQLIPNNHFDHKLINNLLKTSLEGLENFILENQLELPPSYRLPFRELGLSIGLKAVKELKGLIEQKTAYFNKDSKLLVNELFEYVPLADIIEDFWLKNKQSRSWNEHPDINMVMLATSIIPNGYIQTQ